MFNAFIYILPFDIHIFSGTVAEQKRGGKEEGENLERKKINCLRKIKIGTFSFPKKLKN